MTLKRVKEGTTAVVTVNLYDDEGILANPSTLEYRIDCVESREQIRDWTSVPSPSSPDEVTLTPEDNACMMPERDIEKHEITFRATYDGGTEVTSRYVYEVANLRFLSG